MLSGHGLSSIVTNASSGMPMLARRYIDAHKQFGASVWVHAKEYARFEAKAKELRDVGIHAADYATYVVARYMNFCRSRGMQRVPLNMFLGDAATKDYYNYVSHTGSKRVDSSKQHELFYCELVVANTYIMQTLDGESVVEDDIIHTLRPLLSIEYLELTTLEREALRVDALNHLRLVYMLNGTTLKSYDDVVYALLRKEDIDV